MTRYVCKDCGYKMDKKKEKCPYCGKKNIEEEKSAEELVEDVEVRRRK